MKSPIKRIAPNELQSILLDPEIQWKLFPERRITISWEPYKILSSNIEIIGHMCHEIIGTPDEKDPARFSTISFGHYCDIKKGSRYDVEIYSNDESEVLDHVRHHINLSYKYHNHGEHNLRIYFPMHIDEEVVRRELENNQPISKKLGSQNLSLFERDVILKSLI